MLSSTFGKLYLIIGAALLVGYLYTESRGTVFGSTDTRSTLPPGVKSARGGYRSHGFFYVGGYRGGK